MLRIKIMVVGLAASMMLAGSLGIRAFASCQTMECTLFSIHDTANGNYDYELAIGVLVHSAYPDGGTQEILEVNGTRQRTVSVVADCDCSQLPRSCSNYGAGKTFGLWGLINKTQCVSD